MVDGNWNASLWLKVSWCAFSNIWCFYNNWLLFLSILCLRFIIVFSLKARRLWSENKEHGKVRFKKNLHYDVKDECTKIKSKNLLLPQYYWSKVECMSWCYTFRNGANASLFSTHMDRQKWMHQDLRFHTHIGAVHSRCHVTKLNGPTLK